MFELIGIIVVIWIVWIIIKGVVNGALNGTLLRACKYAETLGVPYDIAVKLSKQSDAITRIRKELSGNQKEFATLDAYMQYGWAISTLYEEEFKAPEFSVDIMEKVKRFLEPQLEKLKAEGLNIRINHMTYVYLCSLAVNFSATRFNIESVRDLVKYVFPDEIYNASIQSSYYVCSRSSTEFIDAMCNILPIIDEEIRAGKGDFFVKSTRKSINNMKKMMDGTATKMTDPSEFWRV